MKENELIMRDLSLETMRHQSEINIIRGILREVSNLLDNISNDLCEHETQIVTLLTPKDRSK